MLRRCTACSMTCCPTNQQQIEVVQLGLCFIPYTHARTHRPTDRQTDTRTSRIDLSWMSISRRHIALRSMPTLCTGDDNAHLSPVHTTHIAATDDNTHANYMQMCTHSMANDVLMASVSHVLRFARWHACICNYPRKVNGGNGGNTAFIASTDLGPNAKKQLPQKLLGVRPPISVPTLSKFTHFQSRLKVLRRSA